MHGYIQQNKDPICVLTVRRVLTWEGLWDDLILHNNVRNLGLNLDCFSGQLSKDLLTEQNVLSPFQFHVPRLHTWAQRKDRKGQYDGEKKDWVKRLWRGNGNMGWGKKRVWKCIPVIQGLDELILKVYVVLYVSVLNHTSFDFLWSPEQVDSSQITDVWSLFLNGHLKM